MVIVEMDFLASLSLVVRDVHVFPIPDNHIIVPVDDFFISNVETILGTTGRFPLALGPSCCWSSLFLLGEGGLLIGDGGGSGCLGSLYKEGGLLIGNGGGSGCSGSLYGEGGFTARKLDTSTGREPPVACI